MTRLSFRVFGLVLLAGGLLFGAAGARGKEAARGDHRLVIRNGPAVTTHFYLKGLSLYERTIPAPARIVPATLPVSEKPAALPYYGWGYSFYQPTPLTGNTLLDVSAGPAAPVRLDFHQVLRLAPSR